MEKKTYRVFTTRHYISVQFFDIEAENERSAERAAVKAAKKISPDPRLKATDNGWIADDATPIKCLGYSSAPFEVEQVLETKKATVYTRKIDKDYIRKIAS